MLGLLFLGVAAIGYRFYLKKLKYSNKNVSNRDKISQTFVIVEQSNEEVQVESTRSYLFVVPQPANDELKLCRSRCFDLEEDQCTLEFFFKMKC